MPRNVEIKAFVTCMSSLRSKAAELSKSDGVEIKQSDTFFTTNQGRLKLRHLIGTDAQLVYYDRSDKEGPKLSDYHIVTTDQPEELSKVLSKALGVRGEVCNVQKHVVLLKAVLLSMPWGVRNFVIEGVACQETASHSSITNFLIGEHSHMTSDVFLDIFDLPTLIRYFTT